MADRTVRASTRVTGRRADRIGRLDREVGDRNIDIGTMDVDRDMELNGDKNSVMRQQIQTTR